MIDEIKEEDIPVVGKTGLQKEDEPTENLKPFDPKSIKISQKVISLDQIITRMKNGTIRLSPDFQRNEVWNDTQKSLLVESLLLNIPIPMFYVSADEDGIWDVVDGLQRLSTLRDFIIKKTLRLKNLEFWVDYNGKTYDDLSPILFNRINETQLYITIIEPSSPQDVKFNIFKRINTGGVSLSSQEIRHALYQGKGTVLLKELSESESFLHATDYSINDKRMSAREVILRCLSFLLLGSKGYYSNDNMDSFLNRGIQVLNNLDKKEELIKKNVYFKDNIPQFYIDSYEKLKVFFNLSMDRNTKLFGYNAFRLSRQGANRTPINKGLFEILGVEFAKITDNDFKKILQKKDIFFERYEALKLEEKFYNAISRNSWQKNNVEYRFNAISKLIKGCLYDSSEFETIEL